MDLGFAVRVDVYRLCVRRHAGIGPSAHVSVADGSGGDGTGYAHADVFAAAATVARIHDFNARITSQRVIIFDKCHP